MRRRSGASLAILLSATAMPAHAAWYEAKSKHFAIYADESPKSLQAFATKLEKFDKAVRILRAMDDPPIGDGGRVNVYVLPSTDAVSHLAVGKDSSIAGFYLPRASGSVAFVPKQTDGHQEWDISADTVFFHEYSHHLQLQNTDAALPPWLVEGFAEFYSTAEFERDGSVRLGNPANHRIVGLYLLAKPSMDMLLGPGTNKATEDQLEAFYGWAWVLTHYLTFADERKGQLARYIALIRSGDDLMKAATVAFGDLKRLDRDSDHYLHVNRFRYLQVNAPELNRISVVVRPLRPGEAAGMPARIHSTRGVDKTEAAGVAAQTRAVAASYPDDPFVQRELAEAEFDEQNYAASRKAALRALALDPKLEKALIYKGRAEMELSASDPKADWSAIRDNFLKANLLDTEDAEPLMRYYESFGASGERPTANAVEGLRYALVLAPQDKSLRLMAVAEMINAGRIAEAQETLGPLAYDPHSSGGRERARKVMDALKAKDQKAALAALSQAAAAPGNND
ncbi:tetratricopeptide repeat protein [Sphingomonas sp.]|uniref:tetratricopeptide repeat protein n=1 Tax=Sphingomonas sp. TaxID=28214 RepID=UPI0038A0B16D